MFGRKKASKAEVVYMPDEEAILAHDMRFLFGRKKAKGGAVIYMTDGEEIVLKS